MRVRVNSRLWTRLQYLQKYLKFKSKLEMSLVRRRIYSVTREDFEILSWDVSYLRNVFFTCFVGHFLFSFFSSSSDTYVDIYLISALFLHMSDRNFSLWNFYIIYTYILYIHARGYCTDMSSPLFFFYFFIFNPSTRETVYKSLRLWVFFLFFFFIILITQGGGKRVIEGQFRRVFDIQLLLADWRNASKSVHV